MATGVYLLWPRGRKGGVISVHGRPRERVFSRDAHAVVGVFAGAIVVFLAVTGMPWSDVWGRKVQDWATRAGIARPDPSADVPPDWLLENFSAADSAAVEGAPAHHHNENAPSALPWALEKAPEPRPEPAAERRKISVDQAIAALDRAALPRPYVLTLPQGPEGAFAAAYAPERVEDTCVVYADKYDAHVLDDVGFARFGPAAKAIEWGIAVHQGQQFGASNRYVTLAGCLAIVALAVCAVTMWWKPRPKRTLGLPPPPADGRD
ncbi:MAG TPA: PepSY domain-containing protein [Burkholderiaceae bacterium]|nr:PepSY domain-containing protein [Burkholderiaceae bacterium]